VVRLRVTLTLVFMSMLASSSKVDMISTLVQPQKVARAFIAAPLQPDSSITAVLPTFRNELPVTSVAPYLGAFHELTLVSI
jgi:hypothetical protein